MSKARFMLVLLFFVGAIALLALGASAQTPPPASGTWYISDATSYSDTSIDLVEGGIVIYSGGSLTLTNVVVDIFVDYGLETVEVQEGGKLTIQGGSFAYKPGTMSYPPRFTIMSPSSINGTHIAATTGIAIYCWGVSVTNCTISQSESSVIGAYPRPTAPMVGPLVISNNTIQRTDYGGIGVGVGDNWTETVQVEVSDNRVSNVGYGDGISIEADCKAGVFTVEGNTLASVAEYGIYLDLNVSDLRLRCDGNDVEGVDKDGVFLRLQFDTLDFPGIDVLRSVGASQVCLRITLPNDFMDNVTFRNLDIQYGNLGGIYFNGVLNATIIDSVIDCPANIDFTVVRSTVELFHTQHQQGDASVAYAISSIASYRTVDLTCRWLNELPIATEGVMIYSPDDGMHIGAFLTDANGQITEFIVSDWYKSTSESWVRTALRASINVSGRIINATEPIALDGDVVKVVYFGDFEVPVVTITSPLEGHLQNVTDLVVTGTAADSISGVVLVQVSTDENVDWSKKVWYDATGTEEWTFTLTDLSDGVHTIYVRAYDYANAPDGLHGNASVGDITVDTTAPQIDISYPPEPGTVLTNIPTFRVEGNVSEMVSEFWVSGELTSISGTAFILVLDLVEGVNYIDFAAQDLAGNVGESTTTFIVQYDPVPPVITITAPADGTLLDTDTVILQGTVDKDLLGGQVFVDGVPVALSGNDFEHLILGLDEGENTITVSCTDLAGNTAEASVTVTVDTVAPFITITSPADGLLINEMSVLVEGTVSEAGLAVSINGVSAVVTGETFSLRVDLDEGLNTLVAVVRDAADNRDQASVAVAVDTIPPSLTLFGLENGPLTTEGDTVDVTGSTDPDARLTMMIGGVGTTVQVNADGTFRQTITVVDVEVQVTVRAEDEVGNLASQDVLVLKMEAPDAPDEAPVLTPEQTAAVAMATTSLIILGLAASMEFSKYSLMLLFLPLYARLKKDAVLDNKTRLAIHGLIVENPGMHYNEIIREFGLTNGVAAYHLDVLEREGFLRSVRDGTMRRFYSTTTKVPKDFKMTPDQVRDRILELIDQHPGISQKVIVDELGIGRTLVGYHLKTLIDEGYVHASRMGRFTVYSRTKKRWLRDT